MTWKGESTPRVDSLFLGIRRRGSESSRRGGLLSHELDGLLIKRASATSAKYQSWEEVAVSFLRCAKIFLPIERPFEVEFSLCIIS
jgi:hypothetical protein